MSYFDDAADARLVGATLTAFPGVSTLLAEADSSLEALCFAASIDIDEAMAYQGVRYDATQDRAFPRYAHRVGQPPRDFRQPEERLMGGGDGVTEVWDWDDSNDQAVVPTRVKQACILQAASILTQPELRERLESIRSGLASQGIGSFNESYVRPADIPGGLSGLCDRAERLMDRYRLRSGSLL